MQFFAHEFISRDMADLPLRKTTIVTNLQGSFRHKLPHVRGTVWQPYAQRCRPSAASSRLWFQCGPIADSPGCQQGCPVSNALRLCIPCSPVQANTPNTVMTCMCGGLSIFNVPLMPVSSGRSSLAFIDSALAEEHMVHKYIGLWRHDGMQAHLAWAAASAAARSAASCCVRCALRCRSRSWSSLRDCWYAASCSSLSRLVKFCSEDKRC